MSRWGRRNREDHLIQLTECEGWNYRVLVACSMLFSGMRPNDQDDVNELQALVADYSGAC
jgi:hypothetical protein